MLKRLALPLFIAVVFLLVVLPDAHGYVRHKLRLESTAYCFTGTMADGSTTRFGSVALNALPLGETIRTEQPRSIRGRRYFHVRDRYGWGTQLDFWLGYGCSAWGRRTVTVSYVR